MSIDLTTNPTGLFRRLGRIGGLLNNVNGFLGTAAPSPSSVWGSGGATIGCFKDNVANIYAGYNSSNSQLVDGLFAQRDSYRSVHSSLTSYLQSLASDLVVQTVDDDVTLISKDLSTALKEVISQMTGAASVPRPTVSVSVAAGGSNNGTGSLAASVVGPDGTQLSYVFDEDLDVVCTSDSQQGGTLDQEQFDVKGDAVQSDLLAWDWPKGSGAGTSLTAIDASEDASGNLLTNSAFETMTSNIPDNWSVLVGTGGSTILDGLSPYKGSHNLRFVGTGAELTSIAQTTNQTSGGTTTALKPSTVYFFNAWMKRSSGLLVGVLDIELVDGSNTVITDDAGTACRLRVTPLTDLTTSYAAVKGAVRTPSVLPSTIKVRIRLSTAVTNTESVSVDHLAMAEGVQLYTGGPFAALFSGASKFIIKDKFVITVANAYDSAWQKLLDRVFSLRTLGLKIPDAVSPTIPDSYIA